MPESLCEIDLGPDDKPLINEKAEELMRQISDFMDDLQKLGCTYFETRRHLLDVRIWNRKPQAKDIEHSDIYVPHVKNVGGVY
jgi:hypothetical protein